jgi:hypothetical protein
MPNCTGTLQARSPVPPLRGCCKCTPDGGGDADCLPIACVHLSQAKLESDRVSVIQHDRVDIGPARCHALRRDIEDPLLVGGIPTERRVRGGADHSFVNSLHHRSGDDLYQIEGITTPAEQMETPPLITHVWRNWKRDRAGGQHQTRRPGHVPR